MLAYRGKCSFVKKIRNMEKIGIAVGIVINSDEKVPQNVETIVMSDDGTGAGIRIPSMLIPHRDGKILTDFIQTNTEKIVKSANLVASF